MFNQFWLDDWFYYACGRFKHNTTYICKGNKYGNLGFKTKIEELEE